MIFAAHAGLQTIRVQDLQGHKFWGEIAYRANLLVCVTFNLFFPTTLLTVSFY
jgi:hypothetical protein